MRTTQPTKDADFISWARNINDECTLRQMEWHLDPDQVMQLNMLSGNADAAYQANLNPETANRRTAANKRTSFTVLKRFLSTFINVLVANTAISESDLEALGLPSREHHFHPALPVPNEAPVVTVVVGQHHDITVYVSIPQLGHPSEFLKKKGYHGFVIRYRKEGETEWHEEHSTRLHTTLIFDAEDEGKHLILTVAWINPRIQHGPWSDEDTVLIN
jgi:hypothetical protein